MFRIIYPKLGSQTIFILLHKHPTISISYRLWFSAIRWGLLIALLLSGFFSASCFPVKYNAPCWEENFRHDCHPAGPLQSFWAISRSKANDQSAFWKKRILSNAMRWLPPMCRGAAILEQSLGQRRASANAGIQSPSAGTWRGNFANRGCTNVKTPSCDLPANQVIYDSCRMVHSFR